jgi:hypothetical protein
LPLIEVGATMENDSELVIQNSRRLRVIQKIVNVLNYRNWTLRAENSYLAILRYAALAGATIFVIIAMMLLLWGSLMQFGSTTSAPEPVTITGADLASAIAVTKVTSSADSEVKLSEPDWRQAFPAAFQTAYFNLYRKQFEPHIRQGDVKFAKTQFLDAVFPKEFLKEYGALTSINVDPESIPDGLNQRIGTNDQHDLAFFNAMTAAGRNSAVERELGTYKSAKKTEVCRNVIENRKRAVDGWDSFSTSCGLWYEYPYGCPATRQVSEAVTKRQCSMQFPENIQNPIGIMKELQSQFVMQLTAKETQSIEAARARSDKAVFRKAQGLDAIGKAGWAFIGFLAIMFLYLAIALERHHRLLVAKLT